MKKNILLYALLTFLLAAVAFLYQKPILTTDEAAMRAEGILKNPPAEWGNANLDAELKVMPENISANLVVSKGRFFSRYQWEITVRYNDRMPTVIIDAYNGKYIDIYGPLS